jgi:hypothetical protein
MPVALLPVRAARSHGRGQQARLVMGVQPAMAGVAEGDEVAGFGQAACAVGADVMDVELDIHVVGDTAATDTAPEVVTAKHLHPQFLARCMSKAGPRDAAKRLCRRERVH